LENLQKYEELKKSSARIIAKSLGEMTLMEDYFFTAFMQNNHECMRATLRAFTQNEKIEVTSVRVQHVIKNGADGHGVRYDSLIETKDGTVYEMEVENRPDKSLGLRLRYYGAMFDKEHLKKNEDYGKLPPYVNIVVMPKDAREKNKPLYFVRRTFVESQNEIGDDRAFFEDGEMIILVNALYRNLESYVGKVIHDFTTPSGEPKLIEEFSKAMGNFLKTEEGRMRMAEDIVKYAANLESLEKVVERAEITVKRYEETKRREAEMELKLNQKDKEILALRKKLALAEKQLKSKGLAR